MNEILDYYIGRRKDIHLIGALEIPLQKRLESSGYTVIKDPKEIDREAFPGPIALITEVDMDVPDFSYKLTLPPPIERPWCYQWCLESVCPFYTDTEKERCLNAEAQSTCHYCRECDYFICRYDQCTEVLIGRSGIEDVDLAGHDYTDCRKRCSKEEPCPEGQTIYEKVGWTFESEGKPATFKGREIK